MLDEKTKQIIWKKVISQQRKAYDIAKYFKTVSEEPVSWILSTQIEIRGNTIEPITVLKEIPEIRVHHGSDDSEDEFIKNVDVDNL